MQDQAFLGPESGLAVPDEDGGVDLYVATQWLHVDQRQICSALGLPPDQVRLTLAGVGGAFGGREDLSMHVHGCLLALHTGKPVKMVYNREESFFGHVHRHPATMRYEHGADRDGTLVYVQARDLPRRRRLRVAAPRPSSATRGTMGLGPYVVPNVHVDCYGAYTNNPPCGAMRGFGSVQTAFADEAQMDKLADRARAWTRSSSACATRCRRARRAPTGQVIDSAAPVAELLRRLAGDAAAAGARRGAARPAATCPAGSSNTTHGEGVRRGVGYAVAYKNVALLRGLRRLLDRPGPAGGRRRRAGRHRAHRGRRGRPGTGHHRAADLPHRARRRHGSIVHPKDTQVGSGGLDLGLPPDLRDRRRGQGGLRARPRPGARRAPRSTWSAPVDALRAGRRQVVADGRRGRSSPRRRCWATTRSRRPSSGGTARPTPIDPETGQGFAHVQYAFAAHRAVVDVDVELGLVKVVELACAQDVGKAINPQAVVGQIQGGSTQGMGLALMEEIVVRTARSATRRSPTT